MKTKAILGFVVTALVAIMALSIAVAADLSVSYLETAVNDVELIEYNASTTVLAASPGETVPVVVTFTANEDLQDVKLKAWVDGYKSDVSASSTIFDVVEGSTYIKRLSLTLPGVHDMDDINEKLTLYVRLSNKEGSLEVPYTIQLERNSFSYEVLSVDAPSKAMAGEIITVNVVLKNTGSRELEDTFVTASIPELGISKKAYFGDLDATDECDEDCTKEDAKERMLYLIVPSDAKSGDYTLEVRASNYDTTVTSKKVIDITGVAASTSNNTGTGNVIKITPEGKEKIPTSVVLLTVVLVIVFVVLLIVLIVLLTKKPSEKEDFGETSYY